MTTQTLFKDLSKSLKTTITVLFSPYLIPMICFADLLRTMHPATMNFMTGFVFVGFVASAMLIACLESPDIPSLRSELMEEVINYNACVLTAISTVITLMLMLFSPPARAMLPALFQASDINLLWMLMSFAFVVAGQHGMMKAFKLWSRALLKFERYRLEVQRDAAQTLQPGELPPIVARGTFSAREAFYEAFA